MTIPTTSSSDAPTTGIRLNPFSSMIRSSSVNDASALVRHDLGGARPDPGEEMEHEREPVCECAWPTPADRPRKQIPTGNQHEPEDHERHGEHETFE